MITIDERISAVFREFFGNAGLHLADTTTFSDVPGWDSVTHVTLINAIEAEFNTRFHVRDLVNMTSVGAIRRAVAARTSAWQPVAKA